MSAGTKLAPIVSTVLWGAAFTLIPLALQSFGPIDLMALRFSLAGGCYALLFASGAVQWAAISRTHWPRFAAMVAAMVVYNLALNSAQLRLPACLAILVGQAAPILMLTTERIQYGSFQVSRPWIALLTWFVGTGLVAMHFQEELLFQADGMALFLICLTPIAMATYMTMSRPLLERHGAANVCAQLFIAVGICLFAVRCWRAEFWHQVLSASVTSWLAVAGLVLLTTVLAYTLWFMHLRTVGASNIAIYLNLVPVFGFIFAATILNERLSAGLVTGGLLVVAGCVAAGRKVAKA